MLRQEGGGAMMAAVVGAVADVGCPDQFFHF